MSKPKFWLLKQTFRWRETTWNTGNQPFRLFNFTQNIKNATKSNLSTEKTLPECSCFSPRPTQGRKGILKTSRIDNCNASLSDLPTTSMDPEFICKNTNEAQKASSHHINIKVPTPATCPFKNWFQVLILSSKLLVVLAHPIYQTIEF